MGPQRASGWGLVARGNNHVTRGIFSSSPLLPAGLEILSLLANELISQLGLALGCESGLGLLHECYCGARQRASRDLMGVLFSGQRQRVRGAEETQADAKARLRPNTLFCLHAFHWINEVM